MFPELFVFAFSLLTEQLGCLNIGGTLVIWAVKQRDRTQEDSLWALDWTPSLRCSFVPVRVLLGRVQDGDAKRAVGIDVRVERDRILKN